ncbi:MAG TPA: hypothetical protein PKE43_00315, partial [Anaerolineales bacterium]|nr:hypothetical protein [Anaerolineales bacterium]HMX17679.1 hypothetical protein [Anaerolineales bacterium]
MHGYPLAKMPNHSIKNSLPQNLEWLKVGSLIATKSQRLEDTKDFWWLSDLAFLWLAHGLGCSLKITGFFVDWAYAILGNI